MAAARLRVIWFAKKRLKRLKELKYQTSAKYYDQRQIVFKGRKVLPLKIHEFFLLWNNFSPNFIAI